MSKFYELSQDSVDTFFKVFNKKTFPLAIKFQFVGCEKQKNLIKISKLPDQYSFLLDKELLVQINDDLMSVFEEESITILIEQEIDKVVIDSQSGKIKMIKPDLSTFASLITKYGVDKVAKANQIEELYHQQTNDSDKAEFIV
jgi:hypothetical protein